MTREDLHRVWGLPVRADPSTEPSGRETSFGRLGGSKYFDAMSRDPVDIKAFLAHPNFVVTGACIKAVGGNECVVAVLGRIPAACVRIGRLKRGFSPSRLFARFGGRSIGARACRIDTDSGVPVTRDEWRGS